jgi:hypothetical protein
MGAVKNAFHDEICNRCPECGVGLSEYDTLPCASPVCPIPDDLALAPTARQGGDVKQAPAESPQSGDAKQRNAQTPSQTHPQNHSGS